MNNKGFAISGILYSILLLFLALICGILAVMASTKFSLDKIRKDIIYKLDGNLDIDHIKVDFSNYIISNEYTEQIDFLEGISLIDKKGTTVLNQNITYEISPTFDIKKDGNYVITYKTTYKNQNLIAKRNVKVTSLETINFDYINAVQEKKLDKPGLYKLEVWGASGGGRETSLNNATGLAGKGGYSVGTLDIINSVNLYIYVGGIGSSSNNGIALGGFNGGGSGYGSSASEPGNGGGGATDIRLNVDSLYARLIVAGGGGGAGQDSNDNGGFGGGSIAGSGTANSINQLNNATSSNAGPNALFGLGSSTNKGDGGGGGAGYFGGGGLTKNTLGADCYGAGGGSGFVWDKSSFDLGYVNETKTGGTWLLNSSYYLKKAYTLSGNEEIPDYKSKNTMIGNNSNGYAKITPLILKSN